MIKHPLYIESPFLRPIVIPDQKENLIDPAQTLYRYNDGSIIIDEFKLEVLYSSTDVAGYLVDVSSDDEYIIEYDSVENIIIYEYTGIPTDVIADKTNSTTPKSGKLFQKLAGTTHVLVAVYGAGHVYPYVVSNIAFSRRVMPISYTKAESDAQFAKSIEISQEGYQSLVDNGNLEQAFYFTT